MNSARWTVLAMGVVALMTFFLPIVHISPPLMGKSDWSACDVVIAGFAQKNRVMGIYNTLDYWDSYVVLAISLAFLWTRRWQVAILLAMSINLFSGLRWDFGSSTFWSITGEIPGWPSGQFSHLLAYYGFFGIQALIAYTTWVDYRYGPNQSSSSW